MQCEEMGTGIRVNEGELFFPLGNDDPCFRCTCKGGEATDCQYLDEIGVCDDNFKCWDGSEPKKVEGECCKSEKGCPPKPRPTTPKPG